MDTQELKDRLQELRSNLSSLVEDRKELLETAEEEERGLKEDEQKEWDTLSDDADEIRSRIERIQTQISDAEELQGSDSNPILPEEDRSGDTDSVPAKAKKPEFRSVGHFVQRLIQMKRTGIQDRAVADQYEPRAQIAEDGSTGGFLIPQMQETDDIFRVDQEDVIVRPRATVFGPGDSPDASMTLPALDQTGTGASDVRSGVNVEWTEEDSTSAEQSFSLREIELEPREMAAHIVVTNKLLRNASAIEQLIRELFNDAVNSEEDTTFLNGDGVGKPLGIIGHDATASVSRNSANDVQYADVKAMDDLFIGNNGLWIAHTDVKNPLRSLEDTAGNIIWQPNARESAPDMLFGKPILYSQRNPALGTAGDLLLVDLSAYAIKDGFGPSVSVSVDDEFKQNNTTIKVVKDVDGQPRMTDTLTSEDGSTELSMFVELGAP